MFKSHFWVSFNPTKDREGGGGWWDRGGDGDAKSYICFFYDITRVADFQWKTVDVSRTQKDCHIIYSFFGYFLGKV